MRKNIKDGIFKNAKGLIFAASCLLSTSCANGMYFSGVTIDSIKQQDANAVVNVDNLTSFDFQEVEDNLSDYLWYEHGIDFSYDLVNQAATKFVEKHMVYRAVEDSDGNSIPETVKIDYPYRDKQSGTFFATEGSLGGRYKLVYRLFQMAYTREAEVEVENVEEGRKKLTLTFRNPGRLFEIVQMNRGQINQGLAATNFNDAQGIEIIYHSEDTYMDPYVATCYPF